MTQLNQIVAIEKGVKARAKTELTKAHHLLQARQAQISGISRKYDPIAEDGEKFPPEKTRVQIKVGTIIDEIRQSLTRLFDVTLTKDVANGFARTDIVLSDGYVIAQDVPVTYLLFLEKELIDIQTFVAGLPVLDQAEEWSYDSNVDAYATPQTKTAKTKKIPRNHVKWEPPSPEFTQPAQVEVFTEDVVVGYWSTVKYSGALPRAQVTATLTRLNALIEAVKKAREIGNTTTVTDRQIGDQLLDYVFNG